MEIERVFCFVSEFINFYLRNKESLLKMEIERLRTASDNRDRVEFRNKESLLKMEIERFSHCLLTATYHFQKQRKSPENGD